MNLLSPSRGFSLLEVLIALLIFSFGMLGAAGLSVVSVRTNHSAYLRSQAGFLASSLADRIRNNVGHAALYNATYDSGTAGAGSCGGACNATALATRDRQLWSQQLVDLLPGGTAEVNCDGAQTGISALEGLCTVTITWTEASVTDTAGSGTQTFAWVFQP